MFDRGRVPQPDRVVRGAGGEAAVEQHAQRIDGKGVAFEPGDLCGACHCPTAC
jgi:hypothetical protein